MGIVIYRKNQSEWFNASLAKRSLYWSREAAKKYPDLDFREAIKKEQEILRSFTEVTDCPEAA